MMATPASPDLDIAFHGLSQADLQQEFTVKTFFGPDKLKLSDLLERLTGYKPSTPISVGVPAFVAWYRDHYGA